MPEVTETEEPETEDDLNEFQLDSIILARCFSERHMEVDAGGGHVQQSLEVQVDASGNEVAYRLSGAWTFTHPDTDESSFVVEADFIAKYEHPRAEELSEAVLASFVTSAIFHTVPFQRELLATLTNRAGMPPFFMPLFRPERL